MRIKPTMSHAMNKEHLNELLVKYYQDLVSEYDQNLGTVNMLLQRGDLDWAKKECKAFINSLDERV